MRLYLPSGHKPDRGAGDAVADYLSVWKQHSGWREEFKSLAQLNAVVVHSVMKDSLQRDLGFDVRYLKLWKMFPHPFRTNVAQDGPNSFPNGVEFKTKMTTTDNRRWKIKGLQATAGDLTYEVIGAGLPPVALGCLWQLNDRSEAELAGRAAELLSDAPESGP
jgi:hypothetical protein